MTTTVKVIEHSITPKGKELITLEARYPRMIHAEYMTHRVFSRNAGSSRAIPTKKQREDVRRDPAATIHWGANQPGMQAHDELTGWRLGVSKLVWYGCMHIALFGHYVLEKIGAHKQWANRLIEPWAHITIVWTGTEFDNFFDLRCHPDAEPNMRLLAEEARKAIEASTPVRRYFHLPYVTQEERRVYSVRECLQLSAARCARTSYVTFDRKPPEYGADLSLSDRLLSSKHMSPFEHQAMIGKHNKRYNNLIGWEQFRYDIEHHVDIDRGLTPYSLDYKMAE